MNKELWLQTLRERGRALSIDGKTVSLSIDETQAEQLYRYMELLLAWNEKMNLTAITAPKDVLFKHFLDCAAGGLFHVEQSASIVDVGTGAGFPGLVEKILRPDLKLTLMDALEKRLTFLQTVIRALGLEGVTTVHERAEDAGQKTEYREQYDIATARAVAPLPVLLEYCTPLVKVGGFFIALKGTNAREELGSAMAAMQELNVRLLEDHVFRAEGMEDHHILIFQKEKQTPPKYPRRQAKIKVQPL